MAHPRVEQLRFARSEFVRGLVGLPGDVARRELGQMNSISWMVAHLAWHEQLSWLTRAQGVTPFPSLVDLAASGGVKTNPDFDEVFETWKQVCATADPWLDQLTAGGLREPSGRPYGVPQDVGTALLRMTYHYFVHAGEASAIRQIVEGGVLPEFVGRIQVEAPWRPEPADEAALG
jgi:hypothetical protein